MKKSVWLALLGAAATVIAACSPPATTDGGDARLDGVSETSTDVASDGTLDARDAPTDVRRDVGPDVQARCGDGLRDTGETCDDGNVTAGDGCSATCILEAGFTCTGTPSVCATTCGDGVAAGTEGCDDGNTTASDGCSATCVIEPGWACTGAPSICTGNCGDGIRSGAETCDDGNATAGDGCSTACAVETGYHCTGSPSVCTTLCGDGVGGGTEACDDGNTAAGDGCSATCTTEAGYTCTGAPSTCTGTCGDGIRVGAEACDDGNTTAGDGCSATCTAEAGYTCTGTPSACATSCGDAVRAGTEACDDGNGVSGDGCAAACTVETGFTCAGTPSVCSGICGDGLLRGAEQCDDGNTASGDCCSATCAQEASVGTLICEREPNNLYSTANGPTTPGGGIIASIGPIGDQDFLSITLTAYTDLRIETFDGVSGTTCAAIDTYVRLFAPDGTTQLASNDDSGVGFCSLLDPTVDASVRRLGPGTYYLRIEEFSNDAAIPQYNARVTAIATCGNGTREGSEICDDGNTTAGDGCSASCILETGYVCTGTPSVCHVACGDGALQAGETCDDSNRTAGDGCSSTCTVETGYTCAGTPSVCGPGCGDGIRLASEGCDDGNLVNGDGCASTCAVEAGFACAGTPSVCSGICGDGLLRGTEQCDDGNIASGDCCSATCAREANVGTLICETEANNTPATANGPTTPGGGLVASVGPVADMDYFTFTLAAYSDVRLQTFDTTSSTTCVTGTDTVMTFYAPDGTTVLASNDDGGISPCSYLDPTATAAMRRLAPGTYYVSIRAYSATAVIAQYNARVTAIATCGNGAREGTETCDDGNTAGGDGCATNCTTETGYLCSGTPSVCSLACGNGTLETGETCDDGNRTAGDGCSAVCATELGYTCVGTPSVCGAGCGDGVRAGTEACDDGNTASGDGCSTACAVEAGFSCTGSPSVCNGICGDGLVLGAEQCDDGNAVGGDCCSATCQREASIGTLTCEIEPNGTSARANGPTALAGYVASIRPIADLDYFTLTLTTYSDIRLETLEGLSNTTCASIDTQVRLFAADGTTQLAFDDDSGPGLCSLLDPTIAASPLRRLAPGTYYVQTKAFSATAVIPQYNVRITAIASCGNGVREGSETCDDGNSIASDGCAANCTLEAGYGCTGSPSVCALSCGDGVINGTDTCDDGNRLASDGCSATCAIEPGYVCSGTPSSCHLACGDGVINGTDVCDDGNAISGDGCSSSCRPELGFACAGTPSACTSLAYLPTCLAGQTRWIVPATGTPSAIPDNTATGITTSATVTAPGTIARAALLFSITHTWDSDLTISLTPPGGALTTMSAAHGSSGDNYTSTVLDSTCATLVSVGTAPFSGCYRPDAAGAALLTSLIGAPAAGLWSLKVADGSSGDTGTLQNWGVVICTTP
ncbi:MAG: DVUA0089 family protein [Deltaproteobacteria bacterium]